MQLLMARFYMNATQNEITRTFCKVNLKIEFHTTEILKTSHPIISGITQDTADRSLLPNAR